MLKAAQEPSVAVVLVNWREPEMTLSAAEAVLRQSITAKQIFVVENGSGDDSSDILAEGLSSLSVDTKLLINIDNLGFGGGCNRALREILKANYDFVWLLNNDANPTTNCLESLIAEAYRSGETIGIVGSWLVDPNERTESHSGSWMHPLTMACKNITNRKELGTHRYSWVTAASMLISIPALIETGLFEERFFMYWEDADLNMRMRDKGFKISMTQNAVVYHSAGTSSARSPVSRYVWHFQSQFLWLSKHHSQPIISRLLLTLKFLAKSLLDFDFHRFRSLMRTILTKDWL